jgi:hypothetical protein
MHIPGNSRYNIAMQRRIWIWLSSMVLASVLLVSLIVPKAFAQTPAGCDPGASGLDLSKCYKLNETKTVADVYKDPAFLVNLIVRNIFLLAGIILFFMIMYAGFLFITGSVKGKDQASKIMESAILGFVIMFAAFWIVQIVKIVTGTPIGL